MAIKVNLKAARPKDGQQNTPEENVQTVQEDMQDFEQTMDDVISEFEKADAEEAEEDEEIDFDPDDYDDYEEEEPSLIEKAKQKIYEFKYYISSAGFKDLIERKHQETGIPRKTLANGFFSKCLGTIGDILGVAFNTAGNVVHTLIDALNTVLHGATNIIVSVANGISSFVTLNKTCVE